MMPDMFAPPPNEPDDRPPRMPLNVSPRVWAFRYTWRLAREPSTVAVAAGREPITIWRSPLTYDVVDQWAGDSARACKAVEDDLTALMGPFRRALGYRIVVEGGYVDAG